MQSKYLFGTCQTKIPQSKAKSFSRFILTRIVQQSNKTKKVERSGTSTNLVVRFWISVASTADAASRPATRDS